MLESPAGLSKLPAAQAGPQTRYSGEAGGWAPASGYDPAPACLQSDPGHTRRAARSAGPAGLSRSRLPKACQDSLEYASFHECI